MDPGFSGLEPGWQYKYDPNTEYFERSGSGALVYTVTWLYTLTYDCIHFDMTEYTAIWVYMHCN